LKALWNNAFKKFSLLQKMNGGALRRHSSFGFRNLHCCRAQRYFLKPLLSKAKEVAEQTL